LDSKNRANSNEEQGETKDRRHKHSPRERRNGNEPVGHSGRTDLSRVQCNVYSRCYSTTTRGEDMPDLFLSNGSANTFPLLGSRSLIMQQLVYNNGRTVFYVVRAEIL
jgi:hypothetical protein